MNALGFTTAVLLGVVSASDTQANRAREQRAEVQSRGILQACEAYQVNPANKTQTYPTILPELVKPPWGGFPYLRDGEKDLLDPWGRRFNYAVAKDEKGNLQAYVWTERTVIDRTKVIGMKPPEPKK